MGRYVFVAGKLKGQPLLLGSIYAPNIAQGPFLNELSTLLLRWKEIPWLIGGDFNAVLDVALDCSFPPLNRTTASSNAHLLQSWIDNWALTDIWRARHPQTRVYSFYSPVHNLHVRLDRMLTSVALLPLIQSTYYLGRTHSDHNPLTMCLTWDALPAPTRSWHLQPAALEDPLFRSSLEAAVATYFALNAASTNSVLTEWEAFKVVIRGHCLGQSWSMRKQLDDSLSSIENRLLRLETRAVTCPDRRRYLEEAHTKREKLLERLRCHNYQAHSARSHSVADKAGKLLAFLIRQEHPQKPIHLC